MGEWVVINLKNICVLDYTSCVRTFGFTIVLCWGLELLEALLINSLLVLQWWPSMGLIMKIDSCYFQRFLHAMLQGSSRIYAYWCPSISRVTWIAPLLWMTEHPFIEFDDPSFDSSPSTFLGFFIHYITLKGVILSDFFYYYFWISSAHSFLLLKRT